jgi:hypothetical protein
MPNQPISIDKKYFSRPMEFASFAIYQSISLVSTSVLNKTWAFGVPCTTVTGDTNESGYVLCLHPYRAWQLTVIYDVATTR